jgi:hypothetical protein
MCQESILAAKVFLQPRLAFLREGAIAGGMAVFDDCLGNVEEFFSGDERFVKGNH